MKNSRTLRQSVAGIVILILIVTDIVAALNTFNGVQAGLLIALLTSTTALAIVFHMRCRDCSGCMVKHRKMLNTYYAAFAGIGLLSLCYTMLPMVFKGFPGQVILTASYFAVIALGVPLAIKALTGIEEHHQEPDPTPQNGEGNQEPSAPKPSEPDAITAEDLLPDAEDQHESADTANSYSAFNDAAEREKLAFEQVQQKKQRSRQKDKRRVFEATEKQQLAVKRRDELAEKRRYQPRPEKRPLDNSHSEKTSSDE
uniref:Uncharacterized protein n=1 Tax=uncultured Thiotrichaceae bacterium TaxID=298394 RepID=A0A6S6U996_9GAMM|nr:MAG: Unknown protein [uncultured Thiotrichaceae bacterium]